MSKRLGEKLKNLRETTQSTKLVQSSGCQQHARLSEVFVHEHLSIANEVIIRRVNYNDKKIMVTGIYHYL